VNDDDGEAAARAYLGRDDLVEEKDLEPIPLGPILVVAWAQVDAREVEDAGSAADIENLAGKPEPPSLGIPGIGGVCTAFEVTPGMYGITHGTHEEDEWSSRWCRLRRQE
jgi:hypothetical protein